ncbi:putative membrane protein [Paenibacillus shirakamiensis]|uniref:Membrane protein n=1 Tax=Paenibacillus shirakamiensis TaxID=1265935 RepID=A0ABS4JGV0_9BACL|nr:MauE/DoxX family redox-associated membrane protein [Paenibacillus shirakamiensis]MBP2000946.1 putative membrane protein [Paenibacillus shirakamiensis]
MYIFIHSFLVVIWLLSGLLKLLSITTFKNTVEQLIGKRLAATATYVVPIAEVGFALGLFFQKGIGLVWTLSLLLLMTFLFFNLRSIMLKQDLSCNCFGSAVPDRFGPVALLKILIITAMTLYLIGWSGIQPIFAWKDSSSLYYLLLSLGIFCIYALLANVIDLHKKWHSI